MPTNSTETYDLVGLREDLTDAIWNVDASDTPFISSIGKVRAKGTFHEWQTDTYAAPAANIVVEGADAAFTTAAATVRRGNYTQISQKTVRISGTVEAVDKAGRKSEMAYQLLKRGVELKTDMELRLVGTNAARAVGNDTTGRQAAGLLSWIYTNDDHVGTSPTGDGSDARTDGTQRAFTETLLGNCLDAIYATSSGTLNGHIILATPKQKRILTGFDGNAGSVTHENTDKKVINAVDFYVSDYGTLKVVPHRTTMQRERDVFVLDLSMWKLAMLRDMVTMDIAKIGDADRKQMLVEYTLEARNEKSSGGVFDLT